MIRGVTSLGVWGQVVSFWLQVVLVPSLQAQQSLPSLPPPILMQGGTRPLGRGSSRRVVVVARTDHAPRPLSKLAPQVAPTACVARRSHLMAPLCHSRMCPLEN